MLDELIKFINQWGPTLGVLVITLYRDQMLAEKHKRAVSDLEKKFLENKAEVDAKFAGKSSDAVIDEITLGEPI